LTRGWNNGDLRSSGWSNSDFTAKKKSDKSYGTAAKTWQEQRSFVPNAVAALGAGSKLKAAILAEWQDLKAVPFVDTGFVTVQPQQDFVCGAVTIAFDASTGGIRVLKAGGTSWASPTQQLAQPWYQNLDVDYFHQFDHEYNGRDSTNFSKFEVAHG
jgi:hypothetical protein